MTSVKVLGIADAIAREWPLANEEMRQLIFLSIAEYARYPDRDLWMAHRYEDPTDPDAILRFQIWHCCYMSIWKLLGSKVFFHELDKAMRRSAAGAIAGR